LFSFRRRLEHVPSVMIYISFNKTKWPHW